MQDSFPYIDILIFGVIAIFLIFRLKNILGTKTGFEDSNTKEKTEDKKITNVFPLKSEKNDNSIELNKIQSIDPNFNMDDFLSGSTSARTAPEEEVNICYVALSRVSTGTLYLTFDPLKQLRAHADFDFDDDFYGFDFDDD